MACPRAAPAMFADTTLSVLRLQRKNELCVAAMTLPFFHGLLLLWLKQPSDSTIWNVERQNQRFGAATIEFDDLESRPSNSKISRADRQVHRLGSVSGSALPVACSTDQLQGPYEGQN